MLDADSSSKRKLSLKNVSELIGDSYEDWHEGDFVIIESQTGTGKTYFIERTLITRLWSYKVLFVCNRKNLARQIKKDILKLRQYEVPASLEGLDKLSEIDNITITTYQAAQEKILNDDYFKDPFMKEHEYYDYIILDECHYLLADSSFNNKTRLAFNHFIYSPDHGAITVFMSATTNEIKGPILEYIENIKGWMLGVPYVSGGPRPTFEPKVYSSGMDYSYINPIYFNEKHMDTITAAIQNDTSDNKWLIFISNKEKQGIPLLEKLRDDAILITKDTDPSEPELISIINKSRFNKKVLITTKTLDNGINIKDGKVTNIVILAWDMITFIQMLGRRRVDINNADTINLYLPLRNIHGFNAWLKTYYEKVENINLCKDDPTVFSRAYDNDVKPLAKFDDLFYRDRITKNWTVNPIGEWRVLSDIKS